MSIVDNEFEAVLDEYLFKNSGDQWIASFGSDLHLIVKVDEVKKSVILLNERFQLTEVIKHPRSKDFERRFSNKLNRMKNKITKLLRAEKKAKHIEAGQIVLSTKYQSNTERCSRCNHTFPYDELTIDHSRTAQLICEPCYAKEYKK